MKFRMLIAALVVTLSACVAPPATTPALGTAIAAAQALDQAILAADAAVRSGALHGQDARNTLLALQQARLALSLGQVVVVPAITASGAKK